MKAIKFARYGGTDVLEVIEIARELPVHKGQILVEVHAASINPVDYKVRSGLYKGMMPLELPVTIGGDFSGIVMTTGEGVSEFKTGDQVYGQAIVLNGGSGSFAELVSANAANTAIKPKNIDFPAAAALPLAGVSALQAIEDTIVLKRGQKILIHGGAGGIGHIALQLAKSIGAFTAVTVSAKHKGFVKELGADCVIDYHSEHFEKLISDYDAVFDTVGGELSTQSLPVLKRGGILVSMLGQPDQKEAQRLGLRAVAQSTITDTVHLNRLARLVDNGDIKVVVDTIFSLDKAVDAFVHAEQNHPKGKVVLRIR